MRKKVEKFNLNRQLFEDCCMKYFKEHVNEEFKWEGEKKKDIKVLKLKKPLHEIAIRYLPYYRYKQMVKVPSEIIIDISVKMGVYVTDLVNI